MKDTRNPFVNCSRCSTCDRPIIVHDVRGHNPDKGKMHQSMSNQHEADAIKHIRNNNPQNVHLIIEPSTLMPLSIQVGGHGKGDGHRAFLKHKNGRLLKPKQPKPRGDCEVNFYKMVSESQDPTNIAIRKVIPEFFGIATMVVHADIELKIGNVVSKNKNEVNGTTTEDFLVLRDVTEGFALPAVMDVKIGRRTWGPDASETKRVKEDAKYCGTKRPFGFSVTGMIRHSLRPEDVGKNDQEGIRHGKEFGQNLKTEEVNRIPTLLFDVERSGLVKELQEAVITKMTIILETFERQKMYKIYGSSVLIAFDADAVRKYRNGKMTKESLEDYVNVKLIDFAHVFDSDGEPDENFISGLKNLLKLFKDFCID